MKEKGFKYSVQHKIINRTLKNNKREVVFPTINSIRKIGIVGDEGSLIGLDLNSIQFTKNAKLFFLNYIKKERTKTDEDANVYSSDLNFWGLPQKRRIEVFIHEPFDLLINLSDQSNRVLSYLCAASVSKFKISRNSNEKIYDLVIVQKEKNLSGLFVEIENILNNFNKNS